MRLNQWWRWGSEYAMKQEAKMKQWMYRQKEAGINQRARVRPEAQFEDFSKPETKYMHK